MIRTPDVIVKYHRKHWWKLFPTAHLTKAHSARIFEVLFGRYGFQWMWSVK